MSSHDDFSFSKEHYETILSAIADVKTEVLNTKAQATLTNGRVSKLEQYKSNLKTALKVAGAFVGIILTILAFWFVQIWEHLATSQKLHGF